MSAIDDQNDRLRARVEAAMGAMPQGLSEEDRDEWQATADRLFFQFCDMEGYSVGKCPTSGADDYGPSTVEVGLVSTLSLITGNTYPHRQALRAMGGRWNSFAQGWEVPAEVAKQARALVAGSVARPAPRASRYQSNLTVFSGGGEVYTNRQGRCEDAPCCGCCS